MIDKVIFDKLMMRYRHLGTRKIETTGAFLIGNASHIASEAWLNSVYLCLSEQETAELETLLDTTIPPEYRYFLQNISNGMNVLVDELCLFGKRKNYIRTSMDATRQPFNLRDALEEKPRNATSDMFFIGGYSWDGSKLYIDKRNNSVHYCKRYDSTSLKSWDSLAEMIISEVKRLYSLFDLDGKQIDENKPTIPVI
jgi:hypothetical protein